MIRKVLIAAVFFLLPSLTMAAGSSGDRTFTINIPFDRFVTSFAEVEELQQAASSPDFKIIDATLSDGGETKKSRKVLLTTQVKINNQTVGPMELWISGSVEHATDWVVLHTYTTKTRGKLKFLNYWAIFSRGKNNTTLVKLHMEMRGDSVCLCGPLGRPLWRINNRINGEISAHIHGAVQQALKSTERQLRAKVLK